MADDPNLRVLEAVYAEWAQGDFDRIDVFSPDVEFVADGSIPERQELHGRDSVAATWGEFLTAWKGFSVELERIIPTSADRYLTLVYLRARGRGSGAALEQDAANLVDVRDGLISRFQYFFDRAEGFAAAGVEP